MNNDTNISALGCPVCFRDFELPRRSRVKLDDLDYMILPRVLNCLHTACHSCCEDNIQRNGGSIICPICRRSQKCDGVKYLPLDVAILSDVISTGGASSFAYCCRCHDEVHSFSWCFSCHSPLCEFHHQDHKLSIDTNSHNISTMKEIAEERVIIDPHLPPIACPESLESDCSIFCKTCGYLISAQAALRNHKDHSTIDLPTAFLSCEGLVSNVSRDMKLKIDEISNSIESVNKSLRELENQTESSAHFIESQFNIIRKSMEERESELLRRLEEIASRKKNVYTQQLENLYDVLEGCRNAYNKAESLLNHNTDCVKKIKEWNNKFSHFDSVKNRNSAKILDTSEMYLISSTKILVDRSKFLIQQLNSMDKGPSNISPKIFSIFNEREMNTILSNLKSYGGIQPNENDPINSIFSSSSSSSSSHLNLLEQNKDIYTFNVKMEPPSKIATLSDKLKSEKVIIVEINKILPNNYPTTTATSDNPTSKISEILIGQVIFETEIDKRFFPRHEIISTLESVTLNHIPSFRVTSEVHAS